MNAPLRRVGVVVLVLFALLFVNLNYRQVVMADDYRTNSHNARVQTSEYEKARGKTHSAVAYATDYHVVPERLTPGFEKRLSNESLAIVYGVLAACLALGVRRGE